MYWDLGGEACAIGASVKWVLCMVEGGRRGIDQGEIARVVRVHFQVIEAGKIC